MENSFTDYVPLVIILVGIVALIFGLYKYETPVAIYLRIKDALSGLNYGNKNGKIIGVLCHLDVVPEGTTSFANSEGNIIELSKCT